MTTTTQRRAVRRLGGTLAAEVRGVDATRPLDPDRLAELRAAFLEHHVLVFKDLDLTPQQQIDFARQWGEIFVHPYAPGHPDHPEILEIRSKARAKNAEEGQPFHSDVSFAPEPPLGSFLYAKVLPPAGGDTMFANQHLAYEDLSDGLRRLIDGMRAVHSGAGFTAADRKAATDQASVHPVVRTHPETGRKALYVNAVFTRHFEGMTMAESAGLLRTLYTAGGRPEISYRHRWEPGDMVLWDNRSVMHLGVRDYSGPRLMHRVTIKGDRPR